jgi:hypothetical protein
MESATQVVPQPLSGEEIRKGIASRISSEVPEEHAEAIKEIIFLGLAATCSLESSTAYSKFKAEWVLSWWIDKGQVRAEWWVNAELDDFGRVTSIGIGSRPQTVPDGVIVVQGDIPEVPPDRFRRETSQPIPKPRELKQPEPQQSSLSRAVRGQGKRRDV